MPKANSALEKGLTIIERIARERRPVTLAALAQVTGMPKQTVHRVLQQLEEAKAVQRGFRADSYILGPRMRELALTSLQAAVATLPVRTELERLAATVGESVNLGILSGRWVRYIERVEYAWPLRFTISPNDQLPAHAVAIGKLLLAHLPRPLRRELVKSVRLERFTEFTITDSAALEREFDRIVAAGYSTNNQEYHVGLVGVGVPVRSATTGEIVAALAIHGVIPRTSLDQLTAHLPQMRESAGRIAALLEGGEETAPRLSRNAAATDTA